MRRGSKGGVLFGLTFLLSLILGEPQGRQLPSLWPAAVRVPLWVRLEAPIVKVLDVP